MQTTDSINETLSRVIFPGWTITAFGKFNMPAYLQVRCSEGVCNVTGKQLEWGGRKWTLSPHMTDSEVVATAFKAVLTALEHEAREQFTYRGVCIFDPHFDVEKLVELRQRADCISERA